MSFDGTMTGPQNYMESLRLLAACADRTEEAMGMNHGPARDLGVDLARIYATAAHTHATLALAAASALHHVAQEMEIDKEAQDWALAIGSVEKAPIAWSITETASLDRALDTEADDRRDQAEEASWL